MEAACAEGRAYAMAFVDMRMPPGWDGIETIEKIWAIYPDLQMVICTAYSDYTLEDMIARLGQTDRFVLLKKPFDAKHGSLSVMRREPLAKKSPLIRVATPKSIKSIATSNQGLALFRSAPFPLWPKTTRVATINVMTAKPPTSVR